ncbi:Alpha/Beta hydrolase protein [Gorgonomyces haynaldii]|nr:Alpha/Beta hydrolase protein [Gorgonomyces haynaldii]
MDIVRFATSFDLPAFLFDAQFTPEILRIHNALELGKRVKKALDVEPKHPSYLQDERYVKGEWVNLKYRKDKIVLYLHGGAHIFLSPGTHRQLTTSISNTMGCPVLVLDYGLCPEVMFPGAVEDALACYLALIGTHHDNISSGLESGTRCQPTEIVIMGDSSGACLTLQLLYCIKALGLQMPLGAVLISPFVDHGMSSQSWDTNHASDFMALDKHGVHWAIESYSNGIDRKHPAISPLFQDLTGYPPILIQAGDAEVVTDDALRLYDRLLECNVPTAMQLYQDMFHVFQTFNLKQSKDAIRRIDQFVSELADSDADSGVFSNVELFTKQFINA